MFPSADTRTARPHSGSRATRSFGSGAVELRYERAGMAACE
ncbi:hypothetical protein [Streptomyces sp. NPDC005780]